MVNNSLIMRTSDNSVKIYHNEPQNNGFNAETNNSWLKVVNTMSSFLNKDGWITTTQY